MSGKLIVFEGVEGCGKTTQLQRTWEWLTANFDPRVIVTREPGGTELGNKLRKLLLSSPPDPCPLAELLLYTADRAQHVEEVLLPQLALETIILCDRYTDSTIAYQGYGRGLDIALIEQLNSIATLRVVNDLTLWLDVDVEVSLLRTKKRGVADRIEQADLAFHQRVQHGYAKLAAAHPERILRVDASLSETVVQEQIQAILSQRLKL